MRKIQVIHGGIDTEKFRPQPAEKLRAEWNLEPGHFAFAVAGGYSLPARQGAAGVSGSRRAHSRAVAAGAVS